MSGGNAAFNRTKAETLKRPIVIPFFRCHFPASRKTSMTAKQLQLPGHSQLAEKGHKREDDMTAIRGTAGIAWGAWARRLGSGHESVLVYVQLQNLSVQG